MARTAAHIARLHEHGVLVINLNVDPTFGGATASFATLGDIVLAEPGALIGFAGPNVIRQTIRSELPDRFQTAEFLLEHGTLDQVVPRGQVRDMLARLLDLDANRVATDGEPPEQVTEPAGEPVTEPVRDPGELPDIEPAQLIALARETARPTTLDYLTQAFEDFIELHGDGEFADDPAIVGGLARLGGRTVVVAGHQKDRDLAERVRRNFAMPNPEGYRKVLRLAHLAGRLGLPLVTLVDTPGAYPGIGAEERGQGNAIARCIHDLSRLPVPIVSVVTGEGGSGGALALAVADEVLILQHAYYSVISPEGCSAILFGAADSASRAADALALRPADLLRLGVVDAVVREPDGGAHVGAGATANNLRDALVPRLSRLAGLAPAELVQRRYRRFERFGLQPGAGPTEEEL
jgi:acetyl-CoA carboxylase carboxyl transferase alpha subunit